jgi:hypothetical protein
MNITYHDMVMVCALAIVILIILWSLERRNKNHGSKINLDDLLLGDDGKASKAAFVMHGSFVVTTWVIVYETLNKALTDFTFGLYCASWVAPAVTKLIGGIVNKPVEKLPEKG